METPPTIDIGDEITRVLKGAPHGVGLTAVHISQYIAAPKWVISTQLKPSVNKWLYDNENKVCAMIKGKAPPHWILLPCTTKEGEEVVVSSERSRYGAPRKPVVLVDLGNVHDVCSNVQTHYGSTVTLRVFADKRYPGHIPPDCTALASTTMRHAAEMLLITALFEELNKPGSVDIFICSNGKMFATFATEIDVSRINSNSTLTIVPGWDELKLLL